jgi:hypothetical protein
VNEMGETTQYGYSLKEEYRQTGHKQHEGLPNIRVVEEGQTKGRAFEADGETISLGASKRHSRARHPQDPTTNS